MSVIKHYIHLQPTASLCNRLFTTLTLSNVNSRLVSVRKTLRSSRNLNTFCNLLILKKINPTFIEGLLRLYFILFCYFSLLLECSVVFSVGAPEGPRYRTIHKRQNRPKCYVRTTLFPFS